VLAFQVRPSPTTLMQLGPRGPGQTQVNGRPVQERLDSPPGGKAPTLPTHDILEVLWHLADQAS